MQEVAILGAGGLGSLVHDILLQGRRFRPVVLLDSDPAKHGQTIDGLTVRGGMEQVPALRRSGLTAAIVAIGENRIRVRLAWMLQRQGMRLISAIHPLASIAPSAHLGQHLVIGARAIICVHASIGDHCVLSTGAIVEHDNRLGIGVFLHPAVRLAGGVRIDDYATVGIGSCVIPYRSVGKGARVEPGGVVIRDVLPSTAVRGVPAIRPTPEGTRFVPEGGLAGERPGAGDNAPEVTADQRSLVDHESR